MRTVMELSPVLPLDDDDEELEELVLEVELPETSISSNILLA